MWMQNLFKSLTSMSTRRQPARRPRLCLEAMEDRCLPSFSPAVIYAAGANPQAVVTADFNGDSRLDLAVSDSGTNTVKVLLGNGDGTFQAALTSDTGAGPKSILVADLNGDGKTDLVTVNNFYGSGDSRLSVLLGNGHGTFQPPRSVVLPYVTSGYQGLISAALGDLNGDGKPDLVAVGCTTTVIVISDDPTDLMYDYLYDGYVNVFLGNGDGTFGPGTAYHLNGLPPSRGLALDDVNGDGRTDVVNSNRLLLGNGDGTLQAPVPHYVFVPERGNLMGDVNADGTLDRVAAGSRFATVWLGYGDGSFAPEIQSDLGTPTSYDFSSTALGDFDGDGFPDLAVAALGYSSYDEYSDTYDFIPGFVAVAHNDGDWTFPPPPPPTISIAGVTVTEGNTGTRAANFIVTLSKAWDQPVTVRYATDSVGGSASGQYVDAAGTLTIPAGQTSGTISVLVKGDRINEGDQTFTVNLGNPINATIFIGQAVGTIVDDEPRISISDVSKKEGKKNQSTLFTFTVTLSAAYDQAVTVSFRTMDGTAKTSDSDYVARTGTLTFAPGETTKTITIEVKGDSKRETDEMFYLDLFGYSGNSLLTKSRGIGTILNDD